jgi:hypothetical protein
LSWFSTTLLSFFRITWAMSGWAMSGSGSKFGIEAASVE